MSDNPYAPPPPGPSGHNPYAPAPQQNPYASPSSNPYGSPGSNPYASPNQGQQQNPYAPPSAGADAPWATPMMGEEHMLAERGTRLGAALLDGLLYGGAALIGFLPGIAIASGGADEEGMIAAIVLAIFTTLGLACYQWYLISTTGQSLAKKWLGIRILKLDGSLPGFVHGVLLRNWVIAVGNQIVPFLGLIDALIIFGEERRCLHDYIAGTKVVVASNQF